MKRERFCLRKFGFYVRDPVPKLYVSDAAELHAMNRSSKSWPGYSEAERASYSIGRGASNSYLELLSEWKTVRH